MGAGRAAAVALSGGGFDGSRGRLRGGARLARGLWLAMSRRPRGPGAGNSQEGAIGPRRAVLKR
jgi:hypothetical protein